MRRRLITEIGFDSDLSSPFTKWTNVSSDVSDIKVTRGRSNELDRIEAGELTATIDNVDGRYTPGRVTAGGYGLKIAPRRPIRVYTSVDDNLVHFECVNPGPYDLDKPRFWTNTATIAAEFGSGGDTFWRVTPTGDADRFVYVGANSDADQIPVKAGDQIRVSATAMVSASDTSRAGVGVVFFANADLSTPSDFSPYVYTTNTTYTNVTTTYTVPSDGTVRMILRPYRAAGTTTTMKFKNLKMSFVSADPSYNTYMAHSASGMYPEFRGFVDQWQTRSNGFTSTVSVRAVDFLGVASRPVSTFTREYMKRRYQTLTPTAAPGTVYYWPCNDSDDATTAAPLIGDLNLTVVPYAAFPPSTGKFGSEKVIEYQDGTEGGSFTVDDSNWAKGTVLSLVSGGIPVMPQSPVMTFGFWVKPQLPAAGRSCLFHQSTSSGVRILAIFLGSDGTLTFEWTGDTDTATPDSSTTHPTKLAAGVSYHIAIQLAADPLIDSVVVWVNNFPTRLSVPNNKRYTPAFTQFGGRIMGTYAADFFHGSISHIVYATGTGYQSLPVADLYAAGSSTPMNETAQLGQVLDFASFLWDRRFDTALSTLLPPMWNKDTDVSGLLADIASDASGTSFIGPFGEAVYHSRERRYAAAARWSVGEWSSDLVFTLDTQDLLNSVTANRTTGTEATVTDAPSIAAVGLRAQTIRRNVNDTVELTQAAGWTLHRYRETRPRIETFTIDASALEAGEPDAQLVGLAHGGALSDKVTLSGLPANAPGDSLSYYIEGVQKSIQVDGSQLSYSVTFNISDANRASAFILDDDVYGIADGDASVLIY